MNGLYITVDGVVGTEPKKSAWNGNPILSFRLVANERRFDKVRNAWVDVHASWLTVSCFRDLARNVERSIRKGDRLIVHGKLRVRDFVGDDGLHRTVATVEADSIGHNLIFGTTRFRPSRTEDGSEAQIRAQADELIRELSAEPLAEVGDLLAARAAETDDELADDEPDDGLTEEERLAGEPLDQGLAAFAEDDDAGPPQDAEEVDDPEATQELTGIRRGGG